MTFANPKEETLNLELTSYGRYLLSLGKFKPHQYAFFDDDIIYDREFVADGSGSTPTAQEELQNNIEGRIQESTPRFKPQSIYRAAQVGVFSENAAHVNNLMPGVVTAADKKSSDFLLETPDTSYIYSTPIGSSAYNSNNIAAWNVGFYKNYLISAEVVWTGSNGTIPTTFIPQLNSNIAYEAHFYPKQDKFVNKDEIPPHLWHLVEKHKNGSGELEEIDGLNTPFKLADSSGYVTIFDDFAVLKVEEANTEFEKENFELEVYIVDSEAVDDNPEVLSRLYFAGDGSIDQKNVEYYFEVDFDFDIDEDEFCRLRHRREEVQNIYTDNIFNCGGPLSNKSGFKQVNIYGTAENQDIGDICD